MYVCFECWLAPIKFKQAFFLVLFSTIFLDTRRISRHFRRIFRPSLCSGRKIHRKCLDIHLVSKKSQQALEKKNAHLNFISAHQHSQQTYINSYSLLILRKLISTGSQRKISSGNLSQISAKNKLFKIKSARKNNWVRPL